MAGKVIPDSHLDLFQKKAFGHLATLMPNGQPQVTPIWIDYDGRYVILNTAAGRQKDKNLQRDGRVALSIIDPDNPYRYLEVRGRVAERTLEGADQHIDAMAIVGGARRVELPVWVHIPTIARVDRIDNRHLQLYCFGFRVRIMRA